MGAPLGPMTPDEEGLIQQHLWFYLELEIGTRRPRTSDQLHVVKVCQGREPPGTPHELAFAKWRVRRAVEANQEARERRQAPSSTIPEHEDGYPRVEFGTRAEFKRDRASWKRNSPF